MLLSELLSAAGLTARLLRGDVDVRDVQADSRRCGAGTCFVAARGASEDGHRFIAQALASGAAAIVCQDPSAVPAAIPCAVLDDTRFAPALLAQAIRGWPSRRLVNIGITGTKGKSTTTYLVRAVLEEAGFRAGLLGTISYETGRRSIAAPTTTPDPVALADMTAEMVEDGCSHMVMEVSSHALDQGRTAGIEFRVAVFTNLSGDHMDYHKDPSHYIAAKRRLFEGLGPGAVAVLNRDDPVSPAMADAAGGRVLWYGQGEGADLRGVIRRIDYAGTDFDLYCGAGLSRGEGVSPSRPEGILPSVSSSVASSSSSFEKETRSEETKEEARGRDARDTRGQALGAPNGDALATLHVRSPLMGRHNVYNCLSALGVAAALGIDLELAARAIGRIDRVPGRLEPVPVPAPYKVFVDYAHTDDALKNVLGALRDVEKAGRVIVVFGCGGDRDRTKRPRMAKVAEALADHILVTSDNPRTEDPQAIVDEVVKGFTPQGLARTEIQVDRRLAIARAIDLARPGDVVLIAGKGHENYQIIGSRKIHFDDLEIASELVRRREQAL
jgi:UDP-N-acetylmuramoyl-L-alanyl-D-glutamate--2,6-diaminopimelate ligase